MNQSVFLNCSLHHTLHFSFCKIPENFLICPPTRHGWESAKKIKKIEILFALELLIWHSL